MITSSYMPCVNVVCALWVIIASFTSAMDRTTVIYAIICMIIVLSICNRIFKLNNEIVVWINISFGRVASLVVVGVSN